MAKVKIVPQEDWNVLKKYLGANNTGLILVPEKNMGLLTESQKAAVVVACEKDNFAFNFEGEPDCPIDIVHDGDSYALGCICDEFGEQEDDD